MGDIFKRLVNLAKSEISNLQDPDRELSDEFMQYFRKQPEFDQYREHFEQEYQEQSGQSYQSSHKSSSFEGNQGYDPYKTLEVDPSASFDVIEKAYKKMARKYHPDRYQDQKEREKATKIMARINASFQFIKDKHGEK